MAALLIDPDFADVLEDVFQAAADEGIGIRIVSTYRSVGEQSRLYKAFVARGKKGLPAARPGQSYHNFGLAVDIATDPPDALARVGRLAEQAGLRWGGRFRDPVHIDAGSVVTLREAAQNFNARKLVAV